MKRQGMKCAGAAAYALAAAVLLQYAWLSFAPELLLAPTGRLVMLLTACLLMYVGARLLSHTASAQTRRWLLRLNVWVWFVLYLLLLATLTLFDDYFGRGGFGTGRWSREVAARYWRYDVNLVPGHMVVDMIASAANGSISVRMALVNIFGNLAALMPTAFFLPGLFERQRDGRIFARTVAGMAALIEGAQLVTLSGTFDVDDFILNVSGACLLFWLLRRERPQRWIAQMMGAQQQEDSTHDGICGTDGCG